MIDTCGLDERPVTRDLLDARLQELEHHVVDRLTWRIFAIAAWTLALVELLVFVRP